MDTEAGARIEQEIEDEIGYDLPDVIARYTAIDPDMFAAYRQFRAELLDKGTMPRYQKLLMAIAILTATKQADAIDMYAAIARKEGASAAELREALRVGILFSGGPGIVAAAACADRYGRD